MSLDASNFKARILPECPFYCVTAVLQLNARARSRAHVIKHARSSFAAVVNDDDDDDDGDATAAAAVAAAAVAIEERAHAVAAHCAPRLGHTHTHSCGSRRHAPLTSRPPSQATLHVHAPARACARLKLMWQRKHGGRLRRHERVES